MAELLQFDKDLLKLLPSWPIYVAPLIWWQAPVDLGVDKILGYDFFRQSSDQT